MITKKKVKQVFRKNRKAKKTQKKEMTLSSYALPLVVEELALMQGPATGMHRLPLVLGWSPDPFYDLNVPDELLSMYNVVLREATKVEELHENVCGWKLQEVWSDLMLPASITTAWEVSHPILIESRVTTSDIPLYGVLSPSESLSLPY